MRTPFDTAGGSPFVRVRLVPRAARIAVTVVFFASGAAYGSWVARVPSLQDQHDATTSELGLALFGVAAGAIVALPIAGWLTARLGSRLVTRAGLVGVAISLPLIALAPSLVLLGAAFAAFGATGGMLDLAMNAHGVAVEERYARPILSGFHASFSFGGLVGAAAGGVAAAVGISPLAQFTAAGATILAIAVWSGGPLLARDVDVVPGPVYSKPSRELVALAVIAFACLLAEGATGDWSGIYMNDVLGTGEGAATAAFIAFSLTMTLGRVVGDRLTAAWGAVTLTRRAGVLGAAGLGGALLVDQPPVAVIGFACLGAGLATVVPIVFRAAGQRTATPGAGIAAVSTVGYTAFLVGPPAIGFLAEAIGLRAALGVVAGLVAVIALLAGSTGPPTET
jgi:MFS family permease